LERVIIALWLHGVNSQRSSKGAVGQEDEYPRQWRSVWEEKTMREMGHGEKDTFSYASRQMIWSEEPLGDPAETVGPGKPAAAAIRGVAPVRRDGFNGLNVVQLRNRLLGHGMGRPYETDFPPNAVKAKAKKAAPAPPLPGTDEARAAYEAAQALLAKPKAFDYWWRLLRQYVSHEQDFRSEGDNLGMYRNDQADPRSDFAVQTLDSAEPVAAEPDRVVVVAPDHPFWTTMEELIKTTRPLSGEIPWGSKLLLCADQARPSFWEATVHLVDLPKDETVLPGTAMPQRTREARRYLGVGTPGDSGGGVGGTADNDAVAEALGVFSGQAGNRLSARTIARITPDFHGGLFSKKTQLDIISELEARSYAKPGEAGDPAAPKWKDVPAEDLAERKANAVLPYFEEAKRVRLARSPQTKVTSLVPLSRDNRELLWHTLARGDTPGKEGIEPVGSHVYTGETGCLQHAKFFHYHQALLVAKEEERHANRMLQLEQSAEAQAKLQQAARKVAEMQRQADLAADSVYHWGFRRFQSAAYLNTKSVTREAGAAAVMEGARVEVEAEFEKKLIQAAARLDNALANEAAEQRAQAAEGEGEGEEAEGEEAEGMSVDERAPTPEELERACSEALAQVAGDFRSRAHYYATTSQTLIRVAAHEDLVSDQIKTTASILRDSLKPVFARELERTRDHVQRVTTQAEDENDEDYEASNLELQSLPKTKGELDTYTRDRMLRPPEEGMDNPYLSRTADREMLLRLEQLDRYHVELGPAAVNKEMDIIAWMIRNAKTNGRTPKEELAWRRMHDGAANPYARAIWLADVQGRETDRSKRQRDHMELLAAVWAEEAFDTENMQILVNSDSLASARNNADFERTQQQGVLAAEEFATQGQYSENLIRLRSSVQALTRIRDWLDNSSSRRARGLRLRYKYSKSKTGWLGMGPARIGPDLRAYAPGRKRTREPSGSGAGPSSSGAGSSRAGAGAGAGVALDTLAQLTTGNTWTARRTEANRLLLAAQREAFRETDTQHMLALENIAYKLNGTDGQGSYINGWTDEDVYRSVQARQLWLLHAAHLCRTLLFGEVELVGEDAEAMTDEDRVPRRFKRGLLERTGLIKMTPPSPTGGAVVEETPNYPAARSALVRVLGALNHLLQTVHGDSVGGPNPIVGPQSVTLEHYVGRPDDEADADRAYKERLIRSNQARVLMPASDNHGLNKIDDVDVQGLVDEELVELIFEVRALGLPTNQVTEGNDGGGYGGGVRALMQVDLTICADAAPKAFASFVTQLRQAEVDLKLAEELTDASVAYIGPMMSTRASVNLEEQSVRDRDVWLAFGNLSRALLTMRIDESVRFRRFVQLAREALQDEAISPAELIEQTRDFLVCNDGFETSVHPGGNDASHPLGYMAFTVLSDLMLDLRSLERYRTMMSSEAKNKDLQLYGAGEGGLSVVALERGNSNLTDADRVNVFLATNDETAAEKRKADWAVMIAALTGVCEMLRDDLQRAEEGSSTKTNLERRLAVAEQLGKRMLWRRVRAEAGVVRPIVYLLDYDKLSGAYRKFLSVAMYTVGSMTRNAFAGADRTAVIKTVRELWDNRRLLDSRFTRETHYTLSPSDDSEYQEEVAELQKESASQESLFMAQRRPPEYGGGSDPTLPNKSKVLSQRARKFIQQKYIKRAVIAMADAENVGLTKQLERENRMESARADFALDLHKKAIYKDENQEGLYEEPEAAFDDWRLSKRAEAESEPADGQFSVIQPGDLTRAYERVYPQRVDNLQPGAADPSDMDPQRAGSLRDTLFPDGFAIPQAPWPTVYPPYRGDVAERELSPEEEADLRAQRYETDQNVLRGDPRNPAARGTLEYRYMEHVGLQALLAQVSKAQRNLRQDRRQMELSEIDPAEEYRRGRQAAKQARREPYDPTNQREVVAMEVEPQPEQEPEPEPELEPPPPQPQPQEPEPEPEGPPVEPDPMADDPAAEARAAEEEKARQEAEQERKRAEQLAREQAERDEAERQRNEAAEAAAAAAALAAAAAVATAKQEEEKQARQRAEAAAKAAEEERQRQALMRAGCTLANGQDPRYCFVGPNGVVFYAGLNAAAWWPWGVERPPQEMVDRWVQKEVARLEYDEAEQEWVEVSRDYDVWQAF
jgi:hypothetical protein